VSFKDFSTIMDKVEKWNGMEWTFKVSDCNGMEWLTKNNFLYFVDRVVL
jgi:hypothetical protein